MSEHTERRRIRTPNNMGYRLRVYSAFTIAAFLLAGFAAPAMAVSNEDRWIYRDAFAAAENGRYGEAREIAGHARDRLPAKVIDWLALRRSAKLPSFETFADFIADNPDWPALKSLRGRAEASMDSSVPDGRVVAWFEKHPPLTGVGRVRLAESHLRRGDTERGQKLISEAWIASNFGRNQERAFLRRHRHRLRPGDHVARLDRLIWGQQRRQAERMLVRVPAGYRNLGRARLMLMGLVGGVDHAIARIPDSLIDDPGLVYERAKWRRRKGFDERALALLDPLPEKLIRPAAWWREARYQVREALDAGETSVAYRLAANHRQSDPGNVAQADWLAGWIALRFLEDPAMAYQHFVMLHDVVRYPISVSRAAYWCGRAAAAGGNDVLATEWYDRAATFVTTYYGQLAAAEVAPRGPIVLPPMPTPVQPDIDRIERIEITQVVRVLADLDQAELIDQFVAKLSRMAGTPGEHALVAKLAVDTGRRDLAVKTARRASWSGISLNGYGYPLAPVSVSGAEPGVGDSALLLAMIRQESGFHRTAVSRAGARGLLQLMPGTAREMARKLGIRYSKSRLLSDGDYNVALGSRYIAEVLDRFDGSYVLALAAYNAGPSRVRRWIRAYGDPRDPSIDVIDWIERIPFKETRNYVQRVIEAVPVYRHLMGSGATPLALAQILSLGGRVPPS